jgi:two-component system KDP operon response regulator KdpE
LTQEVSVVGKTILLLDENEASRKFLANTLREKQIKVLEAASGKEALIVAWRDEPDLILFDPILSDFRGEEFIQKLRQNVRTNQTPIVAFSSDPNPARREGCLNAGATEYILKSSEAISTLGGTLNRIFGAQKPTAQSRTEERKDC